MDRAPRTSRKGVAAPLLGLASLGMGLLALVTGFYRVLSGLVASCIRTTLFAVLALLTDDGERPHLARRRPRLRRTVRGRRLVAGVSLGLAALVLGTIGCFGSRSPSASTSHDPQPAAYFRRTPETQTEQGRARAAQYEAVWSELIAVMDEATRALERAHDKASAQRLLVVLRRNTERMQMVGNKLNDLGMSDKEMQQNMAQFNRTYYPRLRQSLAKFREVGDAFKQRVRAGAIPSLEARQVATALVEFGGVLEQLSD